MSQVAVTVVSGVVQDDMRIPSCELAASRHHIAVFICVNSCWNLMFEHRIRHPSSLRLDFRLTVCHCSSERRFDVRMEDNHVRAPRGLRPPYHGTRLLGLTLEQLCDAGHAPCTHRCYALSCDAGTRMTGAAVEMYRGSRPSRPSIVVGMA
mmetsp:Transcript_28004/g.71552  ORF Transcript_28004/g.71552 Transcript_28004/m.71552 type:complete len:151 (+) Transcript_28004:145-597(+)